MVDAGKVTVVVDANTKKLNSGLKQAKTEVSKFGTTIKKMGIASTIGWAVAATAVTSFVKQATFATIEFEQRFASFTRLVEGDANQMLEQLQRASRGTVSSLSLVTQANNAILLGIEQDQLPRLLKAAEVLGAAVGRTTEQAFGDLTMGIGRQSRMILDNLGIIVKAEDAYKSYAKSIGVSVDALTAQQRQLAFNQAVMLGVADAVDKLEGSITAATTATQRFNAEWADFKIKAGEPTKEVLTIWLQGFNELHDVISNVNEQGGLLKGTFGKLKSGETLGSLLFGQTNFVGGVSTGDTPEMVAAREKSLKLQQEEIRKQNDSYLLAIKNADELMQREQQYIEFVNTADLTKLENIRELKSKEEELTRLKLEGISIMGGSFLDMVGRIKSAAEQEFESQVYGIFKSKRQEQIDAGIITPGSTGG